MYQDKVAVALKVNGKVLREHGDTVYIPFGSEYSIFIKNLNTVRCVVNIQIDGSDIAEGSSFIINALDSVEIERFVKSGNLQAGQRLKFIERTEKVEQHRGIGAEDGLVCITFEFEKPQPPILFGNEQWKKYYVDPSIPNPYDKWYATPSTGSPLRGLRWAQCSTSTANASYAAPAVANEAGITVGGSVSEQKFSTVSGVITDGVKHLMVLRLLGEVGQQKVKKALTVQTKQKCPTCNHLNKSSAKFCVECGTGLLVPA